MTFLIAAMALGRSGFRGLLEILCIWHRSVCLVHAKHRRVEIVEAFALNEINHLRSNATDLPSFFEHDSAIGLLH